MSKHLDIWQSPWRGLSQLQRQMDRFFDEAAFGQPFARTGTPLADTNAWAPRCELTDEKNHYVVRVEVPGIPKDAIKVELNNNILTISGEKREEKKEKEKGTHFSEFAYGSFLRSFQLPTEVDDERVEASYENGILTLQLPKTEKAKSREITIK